MYTIKYSMVETAHLEEVVLVPLPDAEEVGKEHLGTDPPPLLNDMMIKMVQIKMI